MLQILYKILQDNPGKTCMKYCSEDLHGILFHVAGNYLEYLQTLTFVRGFTRNTLTFM